MTLGLFPRSIFSPIVLTFALVHVFAGSLLALPQDYGGQGNISPNPLPVPTPYHLACVWSTSGDLKKFCKKVVGLGVNTCSEDNLGEVCESRRCAFYREGTSGKCLNTPNEIGSGCSKDKDCYRLACDGYSCVPQADPGIIGNDECKLGGDECENKLRKLVCVQQPSGAGTCRYSDQPSQVAPDCNEEGEVCNSHFMCEDGLCKLFKGTGQNTCGLDSNCGVNKCQDGVCVRDTNSMGRDWCGLVGSSMGCSAMKCRPVPATNEFKCENVEISPWDWPLDDPGCDTEEKNEGDVCGHSQICKGDKCVKGGKVEDPQCSEDADCPHTHMACQGSLDSNDRQSCVVKVGYGKDQCATDDDCNYHNECNKTLNKCERREGAGESNCNIVNSECAHFACVDWAHENREIGYRCKLVLGSGVDECDSEGSCDPTGHKNDPPPRIGDPREAKAPRKLHINSDRVFVGQVNSPGVAVVFDFKCPFCTKALPKLMELAERGEISLSLLHAPFHSGSKEHAKVFECGKKFGKAIATARILSSSQTIPTGRDVGVFEPAFKACLESVEIDSILKSDLKLVEAHGINGTPTIFVDGVEYFGSISEITKTRIETPQSADVGY